MNQPTKQNNVFLWAVIGIYLSYFVHGMGVITLAQNMTHLASKFGTDDAGIAYIISGIGLGRLVSILFFGALSDKLGRKFVIFVGLAFYILFFLGILTTSSLQLAFVLAVCAGAANAALDTGGYPALMESYPKASGTAVILLKAMISFGQMLYPILVSFLLVQQIWYGYALVIPAGILGIVCLLLLRSKFPSQIADARIAKDLPSMKSKPLLWLEGFSSVIFGVAAFSTFYIIVVWMPRYAMAFAGMAEADAVKTISYYSIGSLVCVFVFAWLLKSKVRPVWANVLNSALAVFAGVIIYMFPSPWVCNWGAFAIGFSAAGGILQLGVAVMSEFFPKSKAKVTSVYMMAGGLSNFVIPLLTGYLSKISLKYIILLDISFAVVALLTALVVFVRYYKVFTIPATDVRFGEKAMMAKN